MSNFNHHDTDIDEDPTVHHSFQSGIKEETSHMSPLLHCLPHKSPIALTSIIQPSDPAYKMAHHDEACWEIICNKLKPIAEGKITFQGVVEELKFFINDLKFQSDYRKSKKGPIKVILDTSHSTILEKKDLYEKKIFPGLAGLVLETKDLFPAGKNISILTQESSKELKLTKKQTACLLAHMAFCITLDQGNPKFQQLIDFSGIYERGSKKDENLKIQKLQCLFTYFETFFNEHSPENQSKVTYKRCILEGSNAENEWRNCEKKLMKATVISSGGIEKANDALQVVFSDKRLGDQALQASATQQPIMNLIHPELMLTILFCEELKEDEAIQVYGAGRYSNYEGYGDRFEFRGAYEGGDVRERQHVIIDAQEYTSNQQASQFGEQWVLRDLNKAYCGFLEEKNGIGKVATGKWGVGLFKAQLQLKIIIQWLAASRADKDILFHIFNDNDEFPEEEAKTIFNYYKGKTVGDLFSDLLKVAPQLQTQTHVQNNSNKQDKTLFQALIESFKF